MARSVRLPKQPSISPLVSAFLVLAMVFLLGVPLSREGIAVSAPAVEQRPARTLSPDNQVVLEYSADRTLKINTREVARSELAGRLRDIYRVRADKTMWLLGAGTLRYGEIADVIDTAKGAGVERVGVITPEMSKAAKRAPGPRRAQRSMSN